jgi:hypothetical protein
MKKQEKTILMLMMAAGFVFALFVPGPICAGELEPSALPGSTMKTLDQIPPTWSQKLPADDGGAEGCNSSRFECVMGGSAVLDKETGLVWQKDLSVMDPYPYWDAIRSLCLNRNWGGRKGWRAPTAEELASLVDLSATVEGGPKIPDGSPFLNVQAAKYWTASTSMTDPSNEVYLVDFSNGAVQTRLKILEDTSFYTWCVRGGRGYIAR